jgi:hypothetical protein
MSIPLDIPDVRVLQTELTKEGELLRTVESTIPSTTCRHCGRTISRSTVFIRSVSMVRGKPPLQVVYRADLFSSRMIGCFPASRFIIWFNLTFDSAGEARVGALPSNHPYAPIRSPCHFAEMGWDEITYAA